MITINNRKFVKTNKEFTETLFHKDGTAYGFYKKRKGAVLFYDMQKNLFAACVHTPNFTGFVNASSVDGRNFFQHSHSSKVKEIFGLPDGYIDQIDHAKTTFLNIKSRA